STQILFKFPDGGTDAGVRFLNNSDAECVNWMSNTSRLEFMSAFDRIRTVDDLVINLDNSNTGLQITDPNDNEMFYFDYLGNADIHGNVTVSGYVGWDTVQLSEYNNTDLQINSDVYLTGGGGQVLFHVPSGSDYIAFKIASTGGGGGFQIQAYDTSVLFDIEPAGIISAYNRIQFQNANQGIWTAAANDLDLRLGDSAGATAVNIVDSGNATVASIDSDGNAFFDGGATGYFDDGTNFRVTVSGGLVTNIGASVAGGFSMV
ncbi:MAG: hypothetical protein KAS36_01520, partial [Anaerolineales bacterium]|nr:hypothetical protein [Anaerolineales bacterium]